jgi:flagellar hook protein FlgE
MNISNNIASIAAHQQMLNTSANNVANVNTDRYIPQDTRVVSNGGSSTPMAMQREATDNGSLKSQTDLAKEIPDQMISSDATAVNVKAIRTQDEMLGSLLDMKA